MCCIRTGMAGDEKMMSERMGPFVPFVRCGLVASPALARAALGVLDQNSGRMARRQGVPSRAEIVVPAAEEKWDI